MTDSHLKGVAKITHPEVCQVTVTTTMSMKEWKMVRDKLNQAPYWYWSLLNDLINKMEATIFGEVSEKK
jgi:hypothetical protein